MRASLVMTPLRVLTWCCVILLAVLSLLPAEQMVRTGLPGRLEHFVAYAGSAAIAVAGYGAIGGKLLLQPYLNPMGTASQPLTKILISLRVHRSRQRSTRLDGQAPRRATARPPHSASSADA